MGKRRAGLIALPAARFVSYDEPGSVTTSSETPMSLNAAQSRESDEPLGRVLADWLEAAEQGRPSDENDYLRR